MNPSRIFILRPVATTLLMVGLLLVGMAAYRQLPVSALPEVEYPTIQVVTMYPGAGPDVMESSITTPLERQFGEIPGLTQMSSTSSYGSSIVLLQFDLSEDIDVAEQDVQAAINAATNYLPRDLPTPPIYSKTNPADAPVLTLALTSSSEPMTTVEDVADTTLAQKISQVSGVGLVTISGGERPAVRIRANPTALASYGLGLEDLRTALSQANVDMPKGDLDGPRLDYTIATNDQLSSAEAYRSIIVAYRNNAPVRLSDVADVVDGVENNQLAAWQNRESAVLLNVERQPGANTITVVNRVKALLPQLQASIPQQVKLRILSDRTDTIRASVADVQFELLLTIALVVMVIFLFLRTLAGTVIPSVAVPLSLVGTFGVMYLLGYSLDNLSLMALTISTGFVVDDAIVMIENIARFIEAGDSPLEAALKGSKQIGFTIVSLTVSLIAVLIPLLFMGDIVGRLFREFAVTLAVTILMSAMISLTLTPMMSARLLRHREESEQGWFYRKTERWFERGIEFYGSTLKRVLQHQPLTLLITAGTLVLTLYLFWIIPKGFFPEQDTGQILGISQAPPTTSFSAMSQRQQALADVVLKNPNVASLSSFIGVDGVNTTLNSGRIVINLKPRNQRSADVMQVIRQLKPELDNVAGIELYMQPVEDITVNSRVSRTEYQYTLQDADAAELMQWAPRVLHRLAQLPEVRDMASDQQTGGLEAMVTFDRDNAGRMGILPQNIDDALYDAFGQRQISTIFTESNQYHVVLENARNFSLDPNALHSVYVHSSTGAEVPLDSIAHLSLQSTPLTVEHYGEFPAVTLSFNLASNVSLGQAVNDIHSAVNSMHLPASIQGEFQGTAQAFMNSLAHEPILILAAIVTVYIVLGVLYESYIHPITILSTLPSAGVGALLALMLFHLDLTVIAIIGLILLIGIVKKNAIMMIDFALEAERNEGRAPEEAIFQACMLRFRPIMMTTMAALLGAVPLAVGSGTGSELRRPLGITIIGGLVVSQVLTLYTTPVVYLWFDRLARRFSHLAIGNKIPSEIAAD
jgi:multidrug efflux pump